MTIRPKPLRCPACGSTLSKVKDVRDAPRTVKDQLGWQGEGLWRRRECLQCHATFTTEEIVRTLDLPHSATSSPPA